MFFYLLALLFDLILFLFDMLTTLCPKKYFMNVCYLIYKNVPQSITKTKQETTISTGWFVTFKWPRWQIHEVGVNVYKTFKARFLALNFAHTSQLKKNNLQKFTVEKSSKLAQTLLNSSKLKPCERLSIDSVVFYLWSRILTKHWIFTFRYLALNNF